MSKNNNIFSNPVIKDKIEILYESEEKLIFRTYLQPKGGQSGLHYHTAITEKFKIIEGELNVIINNEKKQLQASEQAIIKKFDTHQFFNNSNEQVIFEVEITPAKEIKKALQIMYGLAKDGKVYKNGLPKNIIYTAIGIYMMDAYVPTIPRFLQKMGIIPLAYLAKSIGIEKKLILKYTT